MTIAARAFLIQLVVGLTLLGLTNCGGSSNNTGPAPAANANEQPANAAAPASANNTDPAAKLDRFMGKWGGYAGKTTAAGGQVGLDSRFMNTTVKKNSAGELTVEGDVWNARATLKYDPTAQKYLLSMTADNFPNVADVPMTYSDTDGFMGETVFKNGAKEYKAKATIKDANNVSEWKMDVTQGKDLWLLTLRLGKEQ